MGVHARGVSLALFLALCIGCTSTRPVPARLYNTNSGDVIQAVMSYAGDGHGLMSATLPTGEVCKGEYTLGGVNSRYIPPPPFERTPSEGRPPGPKEQSTEDPTSWPEAYGYGSDTFVQPLGSATMAGDRGTVIELVIYHYYYYNGVHGDGVGRDNHGNWYRVHIGQLPKS